MSCTVPVAVAIAGGSLAAPSPSRSCKRRRISPWLRRSPATTIVSRTSTTVSVARIAVVMRRHHLRSIPRRAPCRTARRNIRRARRARAPGPDARRRVAAANPRCRRPPSAIRAAARSRATCARVAGALVEPRHEHGVAGARRTKRSATPASTTYMTATANAAPPPHTAPPRPVSNSTAPNATTTGSADVKPIAAAAGCVARGSRSFANPEIINSAQHARNGPSTAALTRRRPRIVARTAQPQPDPRRASRTTR